MNDKELDEMLNQWDAPPVRSELRENVAAGFVARKTAPRRWFTWPSWHVGKGLFAGLAAGAAVFLVVIGQAFPQSLGRIAVGPIPFTVESEYIDYNPDGSQKVTEYATTFLRDGHEWILEASYPGSALMTLHTQLISTIHLMFFSMLRPFEDVGDLAKVNAEYIQRGCVWWGAKGAESRPVNHETVLGYRTTVTETLAEDGQQKSLYTQWRAPDLGCIQLKTTYAVLAANGTYQLKDEKRALKVRMNP